MVGHLVNLNVKESKFVPMDIFLPNSFKKLQKNTHFKKSLKIMHLVVILTLIAEMGSPMSLTYYHRCLDQATV